MWTSSWLAIAAAIRLLRGKGLPAGSEVVESILLVSAVVLVANAYNLILICRQTDLLKQDRLYRLMTILEALTLMVATVLAWGKPSAILAPNLLNLGTEMFLVLNVGQALLGNYFVLATRLKSRVPKRSLLLGTMTMAATGLLPLIIENTGIVVLISSLGWLVIIIWHFYQLPRLFAATLAAKCGTYQALIGVNLGALFVALFLGLATIVINVLGGGLALLAEGFAVAMSALGISDALIAAMQRYNNDYRYGHALYHEQAFLLGGVIAWLLFLMALLFRNLIA